VGIEILWQAIQDTLKHTEIKDGVPLIQLISDYLIDFSSWPYHKKIENITVKALADKAGIPYQHFYLKILPKIHQVLDCNDVDIKFKKETETEEIP